MLSYLHGILHALLRIYRYINGLRKHLQLVNCSWTINVTRYKHNFLTSFILAIISKFCTESSFTGTLKTAYQNNARIALNVDVLCLASHKLGKFIMDNLNHHLIWLNGLYNILSYSHILNIIAEALGNFVANIGVQQSAPHFLKRLRYINLRNLPLSF